MGKESKKTELVINQTTRDKYVERFKRVNDALYNNMKRDTWVVATTAYKIVNEKQFKKSFKNTKDFAETVGYTAGALSKLITVAEIDAKYELNRVYGLTTGQAQELIPIYRLEYADTDSADYLKSYLDTYKDTFCTMSTKDVRQTVNNEMLSICGSDSKEQSEEETEQNEEVVNADDLAPDNNQAQDAQVKSAEEVLMEIIGIVQQAEETCVLDGEDGSPRVDDLVSIYSAILTILKGEELI